MRRVEFDDALIELAEAIILQAVEDYRGLKDRGAFYQGELNDGFWERRSDSGGMKCPINLKSPNDAVDLMYFFKEWPLEFLCDLTGFKACRIRRELGIKKAK